MTESSKRKLRFIIIGFIVLMIPIGYFVKNSIAVDMHDNAMRNAILINPDDTNVKKNQSYKLKKQFGYTDGITYSMK